MDGAIQQAERIETAVTSRRQGATTAAERKRRQRARERDERLYFERQDWQLFLDPATLPQKMGCQPQTLRPIILREIVDNALDEGANVTMKREGAAWVIRDDGPGIDPADVPRLFGVNRPLLSSKRRRLPKRGMLGNGLRGVMGAVFASGGSLSVETRGHRLTLAVKQIDGSTEVVSDEPVPMAPGVTVRVVIGDGLRGHGREDYLARDAIKIAKFGKQYDGPSSPWWYPARDFHQLCLQVMPLDCTVGRLCDELGFKLDDDRLARSLRRDDADEVLQRLRAMSKPIKPEHLGAIGPDVFGQGEHYAMHADVTYNDIPFICEAWVTCKRHDQRGRASASEITLLLNRTPSLSNLTAYTSSGSLQIRGCGIFRHVDGPKAADYNIAVSIITPYVELASDGKEPALDPFGGPIAKVLLKACNAAYRALDKLPDSMTIKQAAYQVMEASYREASGNGRWPANARQIMYAARPDILRLTGKQKLDDHYFTQTLLPNYIFEHADETANWDVVFDDRGAFIEPHTGRIVPLGTVSVREYCGERPAMLTAARLDEASLYPTVGPINRFLDILFIEKEGFSALLQQARIAERFDIAIMSTKGMSVTAARMLLDRLAPYIRRVLVLHDLDVSGFSIFGTLGKSSRRYRFDNDVQIIDIGLRLDDVKQLGLDGEPVNVTGWEKKRATLHTHGATRDEINFLAAERVELNAMTADVFVGFLERKLTQHGCRKVLPEDDAILERHARRIIRDELVSRELDKISDKAEQTAAAAQLPADLRRQVERLLRRQPDMPWDLAVAMIARGSAEA
jgi:Histidine kinase-, DNA gyrase B-, and HSP90-like ATPase